MSNDDSSDLTRRTFVKASGVAAGLGVLGAGTGSATAQEGFDTAFANPRVWELSRVWERGYRGRPDRSVGVGDSGADARHPDLPWNNVRIEADDDGIGLSRVETGDDGGIETVGEVGPYTGLIGPGASDANAAQREVHELDVPDVSGDLEIVLEVTWTPQRQDNEGLLLDAAGDVKASSTDFNPYTGEGERIIAPVEDGDQAAIETYVNAAAEYEISGRFIRRDVEIVAIDDPDFDPTPDPDASGPGVPKLVGWQGGTFARDGNGHGTHVSSISAGTGQGSAIDQDSVVEEEPRTVLAPGDYLEYEVDPESGAADPDDEGGVYVSVFGDNLDVRIEDPDGRTVESTSVTNDSSLRDDVTVAAAYAATDGPYTVYVEPGDWVTGTSAARVERVSVGALLPPSETAGARASEPTLHAGVAPNASLVTSQGLTNTLETLSAFPDFFTEKFGLRTVNFSFGGLPNERVGLSDTYVIVEEIANGGILTVSSAGNDGPLSGATGPSGADDAIAVAATGPMDGLTWYTSGGTVIRGQNDGQEGEDGDTPAGEVYRKPELTAPGGKYFDLANAAEAGEPLGEGPVRGYTGKAGTSMAAPYVNGVAGLVAQAMEFDAPESIALPEPVETGYDDVLRLKHVLLATASETAFTARPYHRAHDPTYDFGGRDPYEGFGRVNPDAAVDAVSRDLTPGATATTVSEAVGFDRHAHPRAVAGYVDASDDPGTYEVSLSVSHLSGGNKGMAKGDPHLDLFVYDAATPADNGDPNVVASAQATDGSTSLSFTTPEDGGTYLVVAKLVNLPGVVNGYDVAINFDLAVEQTVDLLVEGTRDDAGTVYRSNRTYAPVIRVEATDDVVVRDRKPVSWELDARGNEDVSVYPAEGDFEYVEYRSDPAESQSFRYFARTPDETGSYQLGPVEVSTDGGESWTAVAGTSSTKYVVDDD